MAEETNTNKESKTNTKPAAAKSSGAKKKEPPIENKPFPEFIREHFNPSLKSALAEKGITDLVLNFEKSEIPIQGLSDNEKYWQVIGDWSNGDRQFNIYFLDEDIKGKKGFSYNISGEKPSTIESFMIDERRVTLDLMVLYTLQRLNGQKWFDGN